jgi:ATP-binding cassette subfamily F protein 3
VRVGYYDQELRGVDPDRTLVEELIRMVGDREAHDLLGRFLFPFEAQYKRVADLSGGERARLALLKLTMGRYDLLILDEPTNHLDVEMIEALEEALDAFEGTLILVSHDRRFVGRLAKRVWEIEDGRFVDYEGDWDFYRRKREERRADAASATPPEEPDRPTPATADDEAHAAAEADLDPRFRELSPWKLERELEALEERVHGLETELGQVNARLADPAHHTPDDLAELGRRHAEVEAGLLDAMAAWEAAGRALEVKRARRAR